jgi:hypothetical protein
MIKFSEPNVNDLVHAIIEAVSISRRIVPNEMHDRIKGIYLSIYLSIYLPIYPFNQPFNHPPI